MVGCHRGGDLPQRCFGLASATRFMGLDVVSWMAHPVFGGKLFFSFPFSGNDTDVAGSLMYSAPSF